jgi:hypothetical protein
MSDNPTYRDFGQAATSPERIYDPAELSVIRELARIFFTFWSVVK